MKKLIICVVDTQIHLKEKRVYLNYSSQRKRRNYSEQKFIKLSDQ